MRRTPALVVSATTLGLLAAAALAQGTADNPSGAPGVIKQGSSNTSIGGMPAARKGDATDDGGTVEGGSPNVFINGKPAVTMGDKTNCGGIAIGGASNVFINGKPVARAGDLTSGCK
jgi:uncharacterized Zn-binding protein involved in type VI secretion